MIMRDILELMNPDDEVKIPDDIKDIVGRPEPNTKLSDHISQLISQGILDVRGLPVYIRALEVENLQEADNPNNKALKRETCALNARIYHDCLNRPREQGEICSRKAREFVGEEEHNRAMGTIDPLNNEFKTKRLAAHKAAENWTKIADIVYPQNLSQVKKP